MFPSNCLDEGAAKHKGPSGVHTVVDVLQGPHEPGLLQGHEKGRQVAHSGGLEEIPHGTVSDVGGEVTQLVAECLLKAIVFRRQGIPYYFIERGRTKKKY